MKQELEFTTQLAREAGAMLMEGWRSFDRLTDKDDGEVVTDLDKKINAFILDRIQKEFPDDDILSEEDDPVKKGNGSRLWVVDPIDGTVNMTRGIPFFCVSIGLWDEGEARIGVVFDPVHDELFSAVAGKGAELNGDRISTGNVELEDGLVFHGQPYNKEDADDGWERVTPLREESLFDRQLGSAALMLCYVACGRGDVVSISQTTAWDSAAGALLIWEAGGEVTDFAGDPWKLDTLSILGGSKRAHKEALEILTDKDD